MKKRQIISLILICTFLTSLAPVMVQGASIGDKTITSKGACVMDYTTGKILYEHNGNVRRVPASMTKIMNMYLVYEALENGEITLNTTVPISKNVYQKSRNSVYQSVLPLNYNETYTVDEMMSVIVTFSASGAAIAMAELISGSEAEFVKRMNRKAKEMGIDAEYFDSCGIANNQITPIGMANLARNIIMDYPDILVRSAKKSVRFHGNTYKTTNHLLDTFYYEGADGLKTGTTSAAGYCFCGTAVRNGKRVISVTMASSSTKQRFLDTAVLLDYGFSKASSTTVPTNQNTTEKTEETEATEEEPTPNKNTTYDPVVQEMVFKHLEEVNKKGTYYSSKGFFINGYPIPLFEYGPDKREEYIVAEYLDKYRFDVSYSNGNLSITYNPEKELTAIDMSFYKSKAGEKAFAETVKENATCTVSAYGKTHTLNAVYNADGRLLINANDFAKLFSYSVDPSGKFIFMDVYAPVTEAVLPNGEKLSSKSAFIMDFETGNELYSFDPYTQRPVASIAKMMSVYVILDAIKNGEISLDTIVPISENVYNLSRVEDYKMMVNLEYSETYTVDEMLDMIIIDSAAACVTAVAELISGSETEFVKRMNQKAQEIGINSVFYNGTGVCLNKETDKENLMNAYEVAVMTRKMIQDYPSVLERTKCASVDFHGKTYYNLNKLFTDFYYKGADGFKNGMTEASGYCMCATALIDGKRVITVTLPSASNEERFTDSIKMFDYGLTLLGANVTNATVKENTPTIKDSSNVKINIDGNYEMIFKTGNVKLVNSALLVPIRELMETMYKTVSWDENSKEVVISDATGEVRIKTNSNLMTIKTVNPIDNSETLTTLTMSEKCFIDNSVTYAPLKDVVEAFSAAVIFDEDTNTLLIIAGVC